MKVVAAFLKLIRWPNLLFIALTQALFYFCVVTSVYFPNSHQKEKFSQIDWLFLLLMAASITIAAAGYIINDYFDLQIDALNKPEKIVVDKIVKRRWAIIWHLLLSLIGIGCSWYVSFISQHWIILIANFICVLLLWWYSTTFKKQLLTGNIVISLLTAWVIVIIYFFEGANIITEGSWTMQVYEYDVKKLFKLTAMYGGFAFIISLIREIVKDMEDMQGDASFNCNTLPIAWGVPVAKVFSAVWIVVCIGGLLLVDLYAWQTGLRISIAYSLLFIVSPLGYILYLLHKAITKSDYHRISNYLKLVMLAGILSMIFIKFHA